MSLSGEKEIAIENRKSIFYSGKHFSRILKKSGVIIYNNKTYSLLFIMVIISGIGEIFGRKFSIGWWLVLILVVINNFFDGLSRKNDEKKV